MPCYMIRGAMGAKATAGFVSGAIASSYVFLSMSISVSLGMLSHIEILDNMSLSVPFATSGCLGTVILCSPASVVFRNLT